MGTIFLDDNDTLKLNKIYYEDLDSDLKRIYKILSGLKERRFTQAPVISQRLLDELLEEFNKVKFVPLTKSYVVVFEKKLSKKHGILYKIALRPEHIRILGEEYENPLAPVETGKKKVCKCLGVFYADVDGHYKNEGDIISEIELKNGDFKAYIY